jgi:predicted permease
MFNGFERVGRRFLFWMQRNRLERELNEELDLHIHLKQTNDVNEDCRREMGNLTRSKEECRDEWGFAWLEHLFQDIRYALRTLAANPGFALIAVLSLALGIAGNTAIFSVINALLIKPLPFPESNRLVRITGLYPKALFERFDERSKTMEIAYVSAGSDFNLTGNGPAIRVTGSETSANFFAVLGTTAQLGRAFRPGENSPGNDGVVVISNQLWQNKFQGNPGVLGQTVAIAGVNRRIVGITGPGFAFPSVNVQFWIPARIDPGKPEDYWGGAFVPLIGRLKPSSTMGQARNEIHSLAGTVWTQFPWPMPKHWNADSTVLPLQTDLAGESRTKLFLLFGAVGAVLVIACANVAALLLVRAISRRKEIAMRAALGAGVGRIVRQLLTESVVLSVAAGFLGLSAGTIALSLFRFALPVEMAGLESVRIDWRVCAFAAGLSLSTGLCFGIIPAWNAKKLDLVEAMRAGSQRSATKSWMAFRSWLIAGEIALTVVLVVAAGLLTKSLYDLTTVDRGFNAEKILSIEISPNESFCKLREACVAFYNRLIAEARGMEGVADAAAANTVPLDGKLPEIPGDVEDHPRTPDFPSPMLWTGAVTSNYFRLMQIPLISGRAFQDSDGPDTPPVLLISAATAKRFWPKGNAIGKHIRRAGDKEWRTIVGVVADVRQFSLSNQSPGSISGAIYMAYAQALQDNGEMPAAMNLLVKTTGAAEAIPAELRRVAINANPDVPVGKVVTLTAIAGESISGLRLTIWVFLSFAGAALLLAAIGLYGLMSYSVSQRKYEISVRMAMGARTNSVLGLVVGQGLRITLAGTIAGALGSLVLTRFLSGLLFGVTPTDPLTYAGVFVLVFIVATAASSIPAWRATRIDPIRTLRAE